MTKSKKIESTAEAWESGELGCDESHVSLSQDLTMDIFNDVSESKAISIRLKESMISDLKMLGAIEGIGYQTLIKSLLERYIDCEYKMLARKVLEEKTKASIELEESGDASEIAA
jgi:predicted DNA binding CopG/RHH family protein